MMKVLRVLHSKLREAAKGGSRVAQALTGEGPRSPHWSTVRRGVLVRHGDKGCEMCGSKRGLQVHHEKSFHEHPQLELADGTGHFCQLKNPDGSFVNNMIVLGESVLGCECHLHGGHGGDFHRNNPNIRADAAEALAHPERRAAIFERAKAAAIADEERYQSTMAALRRGRAG